MVGSVVAAIVVKEKHVVDAFRRAGATTPDTAVAPEAMGVAERVAFRRLCQHSVLREASSGAFYLDEPSWQACSALRRRVALVALVGLLVVLIAGILIWLRTQ
jgi:hypothetical protein